MKPLRAALLSAAATAIAVAAWAQTSAVSPGSGATGLPPGLIRQGNVIMMQPIQDSAEASGPNFGGERREGLVHFLTPADHAIFDSAFESAARGDWSGAQALAASGQDAVARKIVEWRYLIDKNAGASFAQIAAFLRDNPDWPEHDTLVARAEEAIDPMTDPHTIIAWFGDREPQTGIGKVRLGEALVAAGSETRGRELIRKGWIEGSFDPTQEFAIVQKDGNDLTPDTDIERINALLWRNDVSSARRELSGRSGPVVRQGPRIAADGQRRSCARSARPRADA
jgi:soluble lytic murein transglycosylase